MFVNLFPFFILRLFKMKKNQILSSLSGGSNIRVVLATSALGCGVDMKNVHFVIHFGPAYDTVDFCQQIGRAGRENTNYSMCHSILYVFPRYGKVSERMKEYMTR